jgi:hypothetical protein
MGNTMIDTKPNYCPYLNCSNTHRFWIHGSRKLCGLARRFRCCVCRRTFSLAQFYFEFRNKRIGLNHHILAQFTAGLSNRQIARGISASECLVRERIQKMAKQGLLFHAQQTLDFTITEPVAYDGLENFARSQYEPNNINQAIGSKSLFIYDFNFAPLNRKGRMSDRQKLNDEKLAQSLGRFPKSAIKTASIELFNRLVHKCRTTRNPLKLLTDEHFQYRRAVRQINRRRNLIDHATVSSKAARTYKNILFPVNHADLLARQHIKAFARETISFSKTHAAMVQKFALFAVWKNYIRPQFTKPHKADPRTNVQTPAQSAGVTHAPLKFGDLYTERLFKKHITLNQDWQLFIEDQTPFNRARTPKATPHLSAHN